MPEKSRKTPRYPTRTCKRCRTEFEARSSNQEFCAIGCRDAWVRDGNPRRIKEKTSAAWWAKDPEERAEFGRKVSAGTRARWATYTPERRAEIAAAMSAAAQRSWDSGSRAPMGPARYPARRCDGCGAEYTPRGGKQSFCGRACRLARGRDVRQKIAEDGHGPPEPTTYRVGH